MRILRIAILMFDKDDFLILKSGYHHLDTFLMHTKGFCMEGKRHPQVFCVYSIALWFILSMSCVHKTVETPYWVLEGPT